MKHALILAFLLVGCGQVTKEVVKESPISLDSNRIANVADSDVPIVLGAGVDPSNMASVALADRTLLKQCDEVNETQLAYIIAEEIFVICKAGEWAEIEIKGKDGAQGVAGAKGDKGDTGAQGERGEKGLAGGIQAEWVSPRTGKIWRYAGLVTNANWRLACNAIVTFDYDMEYRIPTSAEVIMALGDGLISMNTVLDIWARDPGTQAEQVWVDGASEAPRSNTLSEGLKSQNHAMFCIKR